MENIKHFGEMDLTEKMIAYEQDELQDCEIIHMFQEFINLGCIKNLQGHYGRMARDLIEAGFISATPKGDDL